MHGRRTDRVQRVPRTRDRVLQDAVAYLPSTADGGDVDVAERRESEIEAARVLIGRDRDLVLDMLSRDDRLVRPRGRRKPKRAKNGEGDEDSAHRGSPLLGSPVEYPPDERDGLGADEQVASHGPPVAPTRTVWIALKRPRAGTVPACELRSASTDCPRKARSAARRCSGALSLSRGAWASALAVLRVGRARGGGGGRACRGDARRAANARANSRSPGLVARDRAAAGAGVANCPTDGQLAALPGPPPQPHRRDRPGAAAGTPGA